MDIRHTQLFSLVYVGSSLEPMEECGKHLRRFFTIRSVISKGRNSPGQIVIIPEQTVPSRSVKFLLPVGKYFLNGDKVLFRFLPLPILFGMACHNMLELKYHGQLRAVRIAVQLGIVHIGPPCLSYCHNIIFLESLPAHFPDIFMEPGPILPNLFIRHLSQ